MQEPNKIYVITNPMPLHNTSPLVSLSKFVRVIHGAGYSVEVFGARIPQAGIPDLPEGVTVKSYSYGGNGIVKMMSYVLLQLRMFFSFLFRFRKGDVVYFWIADKMVGPFLAAKLKGAETNYFLYGRIFGDGRGGFSEKLVMYMANRASYVCAESKAVFDQWDIPADAKLNDIRLFVPESGVSPIPYGERSSTVAMYCRLCEGKHIDDSIRAFVKVHSQMPEYKLKIIGGGVLEDDMRRLVTELDANEYISITGWLEHGEAIRNIADSRVLLFPTDAEGVPGGVLEAMSMGVPALASPAGGIPDVIEEGVDGAFLSDTDADTIAAELTAILSSDKLPDMSEAAARKIETCFSLEAAAANFSAVRESHT